MKKLILALSLIPVLTFGQVNNSERFISVRGESEINIVPDRIELTITYSETENIKKENELQQKEAELIKLLKSFSIDLKKLTIDNFAANRHGYYNSSSNKVRMSKVFKLQLENIEIVDSLIIKLFETGANNVAVTNLQSDKLEDTKLEATKIALDKATKKAEIMASHLNSSIGQILEVSEFRPQVQAGSPDDAFYLRSKTVTAYGVNRIYNSDSEDIGIRKIRVRYIVDVKYELK
jgi:uncharacterized protein YggE